MYSTRRRPSAARRPPRCPGSRWPGTAGWRSWTPTASPGSSPTSTNPAATGPSPSTACAQVGRNVEIPMRISPAINVADIGADVEPAAPQPRRHHRLGGAPLDGDVAPAATTAPANTSMLCGEVQPHRCRPAAARRPAARPRAGCPRPRSRRGGCAHHPLVEVAHDQHQRDRADRQVHEEDPSPGGVLGERRRRAQGRGPPRSPRRWTATPAPGRVRLRSYRSPATVFTVAPIDPAPRPCSPRNRSGDHVPGDGRERRAGQEHQDAEHQDGLAAVQVGELAVDRDRHRLGEQVDREHPAHQREPARGRRPPGGSRWPRSWCPSR